LFYIRKKQRLFELLVFSKGKTAENAVRHPRSSNMLNFFDREKSRIPFCTAISGYCLLCISFLSTCPASYAIPVPVH